MEQETKLGILRQHASSITITEKGHHLEPITFYLADLDKKI